MDFSNNFIFLQNEIELAFGGTRRKSDQEQGIEVLKKYKTIAE